MVDNLTEPDPARQRRSLEPTGEHDVPAGLRQLHRVHEALAADEVGQYRGHGLQGLDVGVDVGTGFAALDDEHPDRSPAAQERHAQERMERFLAGLRPKGEAGM